MLELHKTNAGEQMFISQMDNEHLQNTINCYFIKIEQAKSLLNTSVSVDKLKSALYEIDNKQIAKQASRLIKRITEKLYPYLAEAMLRGISYTERMQKVYERKIAEPKFDIKLLEFNPPDEYDDPECDD